jgi:urea ABC transporter ATP-binding protein UrtD
MTLLSVQNVTKSFGPLIAVNDVSLSVESNEVVGLIGPNGSGKSTLLHTLCGRTLADSGSITLNGKEIARMSPARRARSGMAIKFQLARVYNQKTVRDNLLLALQAETSVLGLLFSRTRHKFDNEIEELLSDFGLQDSVDSKAGELSHGAQQWLEIAMAMARKPDLLLLDEPTAGMSPAERQSTGELITRAAGKCGILIVEHDLGFIRSLCDRINVLHQGSIVAVGTPGEIEKDERVKEVYLTRV